MEERASHTFDRETIKFLDELIKFGEFRNRSHAVESAIKLLVTIELNEKEARKIKNIP